MNSTVVWIITAMLWYQGPGDYGSTNYEAQQFDGRGECLGLHLGQQSRPG